MSKTSKSKEFRMKVHSKTNGKCAYCGCELEYSKMQIDHVEPIIRKYKYNMDKRRFEQNGEMEYPERDCFENMMPSCRSCNTNKHSMALEDFRNLIAGFINSLNAYSVQYSFAKRYGLVQETIKPVVFYFETITI